ncbi:hypothetical protein VDGL01_10141 [Verticillium dahliae]
MRGTLWHFEVFITCTRADTDARWYPGGLQIHFTAQRHSPRPGEAAQESDNEGRPLPVSSLSWPQDPESASLTTPDQCSSYSFEWSCGLLNKMPRCWAGLFQPRGARTIPTRLSFHLRPNTGDPVQARTARTKLVASPRDPPVPLPAVSQHARLQSTDQWGRLGKKARGGEEHGDDAAPCQDDRVEDAMPKRIEVPIHSSWPA